MPIYRTCACCGAHLDPGEHCDCDEHEQPEVEEARLPRRTRTIYPREWNSEAYLRQRWLEFDMR